MSTATSSPTKGAEPITWNFKLLAQNDLGGFGGMGEGMSVQIAKDGRRIIWLAHESAPKNFTAVDVSDPRQPKIVAQTDLPKPYMRSNSLELSGDIMAVAYQTQKGGMSSRPGWSCSIYPCRKSHARSHSWIVQATSRGVHQLWFCDGEYVHMAAREPRSLSPAIRLTINSIAASRCGQSLETGRDRPLVDAGHQARRNAAAAPGRRCLNVFLRFPSSVRTNAPSAFWYSTRSTTYTRSPL